MYCYLIVWTDRSTNLKQVGCIEEVFSVDDIKKNKI